MKYKTRELWVRINSHSNTEYRGASDQWDKNIQDYWMQLEQLKPRLNDQANGFFTTEDLHDGRLLAFTVGDDIDFANTNAKKFSINDHNTAVRLTVLGENLDVLFTLHYSKVKRVVFDYPTDDPLFHDEGNHIGDWGYDELTAAGGDYLRHEILFSSGTTIIIEFEQFSYEKEIIEGTRYQNT
jgi:hypothetical protein